MKKKANKKSGYRMDFLDWITFISVLFIGADKFGIDIGVNIRLDQIFLIIMALCLMKRRKFILSTYLPMLMFLFATFFSTLLSFNLKRGAIYYLSIIYNYAFVFSVFASYIKYRGIFSFIHLFRKTMYVQFFLLILQFVMGLADIEIPFLPSYGVYLGIKRYSLWFYEPSYLVTYVIFWLSVASYEAFIRGNNHYLKDFVMAVLMIVLSTSTTGFLGIGLIFLSVIFFSLFNVYTKRKILYLLLSLSVILIVSIIYRNAVMVFVGRLFSSSLDSASGNRITLWGQTLNVFLENPFFGVGPGNYGLYFNGDEASVPSNVTLELLATLGLIGFLPYLLICLDLIRCSFSRLPYINRKNHIIEAMGFALIIFFIVLQANQGYLRLYQWMFWGIIYGAENSSDLKKKIMIPNRLESNMLRTE